MPNFGPSAHNPLPNTRVAKRLIAVLEDRLRYNPDAGESDADTLAIVRAYANGELVKKDTK